MNIKLKKPKIPYEGWTIESDIGQKTVDLSNVVLYLDKGQKNGNYIAGEELRKKLEGKNPLSAAVLDYLIEHPEETPDAWKEKTAEGIMQFIFFWGTIYRGRGGRLCVRYWCWGEGRWQSDYRWLGSHWSGNSPSALLASTQSSGTSHSSHSQDLALPSIHEDRFESIEARLEAVEEILKHHNLTSPDVS